VECHSGLARGRHRGHVVDNLLHLLDDSRDLAQLYQLVVVLRNARAESLFDSVVRSLGRSGTIPALAGFDRVNQTVTRPEDDKVDVPGSDAVGLIPVPLGRNQDPGLLRGDRIVENHARRRRAGAILVHQVVEHAITVPGDVRLDECSSACLAHGGHIAFLAW